MAGGIKKTDIVEADLNQLSNELKIVGDQIGRIIDMSAKVKPITGLGDLSKATKETADRAKELDAVGKQLAASEAKLNQLSDERSKKIAENRLRIQELTKAQKDKIKADESEEGSLVRMRQRLSELTTAYDKTGKKTKEATAEINKLSREIGAAEAATNRHSRGVGGYADQLGKLPGPIGGVVDSAKGLTSTFTGLSVAESLVLWPIALIVAAFAALYSVFTSTADGAKLIKEVMASVGAIFDVVKQRATILIDAFKELFSGDFADAARLFEDSVSGMGNQMKIAASEAWNLVEAQSALNKELAFHVSEESKEVNAIQKALFAAKDKTKSDKERLDNLKLVMKLSKEQSEKEVEYAKRQYIIDTDKAALKAKVSGVTGDQLRAFIELDAVEQMQTLKTSNSLKKMYDLIGGSDKFKPLEESYAKVIQADTEFFASNKRTQSQQSTIINEIAKEREDKAKAAKKIEEDKAKMEVDIAKASWDIRLEGEKEITDTIKEESDKSAQDAKEAIILIEKARKDLTDTVIGQAQEQSDAEKLAFQETAIDQITQAKGNSDKIADIQHQLTLDMIDSERNVKQAILDSIGLEPEAYAQASEQLRRLNIQRKEEEIAWAQKTSEEKKAIVSETMTATNALLQQGLSFAQQIYSAQSTRAQEAYDTEMAAAGDSLEYQTLAKRKFEAEDKKIKQRQAIAEKLQAILTASLNLALAIGSPNVFAKPILIASAVLGLGMALATPIPQFAEGTDFAPSSFIAGEQGSELIRTKSGKMILTPNKATLFSDNSLIGSSVIPADQTQRMLANMAFNQVREVVDMRDTNKHLSGIEKNTREQKYTDSKGRLVVKRGTVNSVL